jgi:SAM-dependent methyltransferase
MAFYNAITSLLKIPGMKYAPSIDVSVSLIICMIILVLLYRTSNNTEGLTTAGPSNYSELYGDEIFTPLYAAMSDTIFGDAQKELYETDLIVREASIGPDSIVVDVGCGTGNQTAQLAKSKCTIVGIDTAGSMVARAKQQHQATSFLVEDVLNPMRLPARGTYTHATLLNFGAYKHNDTGKLFRAVGGVLAPRGKLILHLVNRDKFDPIVPAANVFVGVTPQNYVNKRITRSNVVFDSHDYVADFEIPAKGDERTFVETITEKDGGAVVQNRTTLFMPKQSAVLASAADMGFDMVTRHSLDEVGYHHNYIYILQKRD